jgi:hypothetical protein
MKNFDTRAYCIADFLEWYNNDLLILSPDFQRRSVWSEKAKSYLIDTIIRGKPIPKIIIIQELKGSRTVRVVVDGQQRLRAVLEFINGDFKISRAHNKELAGFTYPKLSNKMQKDFLQYEFGVDVLFNLDYEDILDIFARINSYTVILNKQELLNAKFLGYFKQYSFNYGRKYVKYFLGARILTKSKVIRMAEAELTADLFGSMIGGVQTNKNIDQYYRTYEEDIGELENVATRFDKIMSYIGEIYPAEQLAETNWSRVHLFYTLFTAISHNLYGLQGVSSHCRTPIDKKSIGKLRVALDQISAMYDEVSEDIDNENYPTDYKQFIGWSRRATTDTRTRINRTEFVCKKLKAALK